VQLRLPAPRKRGGLLLGERRGAYRPASRHDEEPAPTELPQLEPLGQLDDALILARSPAGDLYLVDQHRAHERILYESLLRQTPHSLRPTESESASEAEAGAEPGQLLLMPVLVELTQAQAALLAPRLEELGRIGLDCQHFGGSVFLVRSLPPLPDAAVGDGGDLARALVRDAAEDADDWLDHVRISLACRSAIRRGDPLTPQQQRALLARLRAVQVAGVCPHGSPLALRYSRGFLAHTFEW
jgi:DNA mismatch repair protein MutL